MDPDNDGARSSQSLFDYDLVTDADTEFVVFGVLRMVAVGALFLLDPTRADLDRSVALKFLAAHLLQDEESRKRFIREAKAAAYAGWST